MKANKLFSIVVYLAAVIGAGCAAQTAMTVPTAEFPKEGPRLVYSENVGGLYLLFNATPVEKISKHSGCYHIEPNKWYRFVGAVVREYPTRIIKVVNKVDIWQETATGKALNGSKTFEYDLSNIKDCCNNVWAPWSNSFAYTPGYYATFTMWVVDENGRTSNSVTIGPIVVKGEGGPVVPPKV